MPSGQAKDRDVQVRDRGVDIRTSRLLEAARGNAFETPRGATRRGRDTGQKKSPLPGDGSYAEVARNAHSGLRCSTSV
ncbi:hypothetical protein GCM10017771_70160 [Streptomyces capitiformicae]|uniref:Uncharacterized protein n=1 Tax=Streptomyces capitiformicae TaxID=2014920 RepID=A0A918ZFS0_9ACTN|nr:hypothetical protein GCM10017771_70160 [Streptomyces capitiformicae]